MIELTVANPEALYALGERVAGELGAGDLVVLSGPLGAGKTTFARGVGSGLGVRGPVTSPTFVLARTHPSPLGGPPLVHIDAYRLGSALEFDDLNIDFARSVVVVEWGEGILDGVSDSWLSIMIDRPSGAGSGGGEQGEDVPIEPRVVTIEGVGPRWIGIDLAGLSVEDSRRSDVSEGGA